LRRFVQSGDKTCAICVATNNFATLKMQRVDGAEFFSRRVQPVSRPIGVFFMRNGDIGADKSSPRHNLQHAPKIGIGRNRATIVMRVQAKLVDPSIMD